MQRLDEQYYNDYWRGYRDGGNLKRLTVMYLLLLPSDSKGYRNGLIDGYEAPK
jgi:hypothetical protein